MNKTISDNELAAFYREEAAIYASCALTNAQTWRERREELLDAIDRPVHRKAEVAQLAISCHWLENEARFEIRHAQLLLKQARRLERSK